MKRLVYAALTLSLACGPAAVPSSPDGGDNIIPDYPDGAPWIDVDAMVCATVKVNVTQATPTLALAIDQSQSMTTTFSTTTRWKAVYTALMDSTNGVVKKLQGTIRFGLDMWTDSTSCPQIAKVSPAVNNYTPINSVYMPAGPLGGTPTADAIAAIATDLKNDTTPGPKAIVLATDGEPDEMCDFTSTADPVAAAVSAIQTAYTAGIKTYVIGVGSSVGAAFLQQAANAGVGLPPTGSTNATVYQPTDTAGMTSAFTSIVGTVTSCDFMLDNQIDPQNAHNGTVTVDGTTMTYGTDWTVLPDGKTLEFLGNECNTIKSGNVHDIEAEFPCRIIIGKIR
jgi:hypothetical protein